MKAEKGVDDAKKVLTPETVQGKNLAMGRSWVSEEYGDVITIEEACKVLRVSRSKLASWIRFKKIKATIGENGEKLITAREVQDILDNPKRRIQVFGTSTPEKIHDLIRDEVAFSLEPGDIERIVGAIKPWLTEQVAKEVEKQSRVVIRREVSTNVDTSKSGASTRQDAPMKIVDNRDIADVPWQRTNVGTSDFPLYL